MDRIDELNCKTLMITNDIRIEILMS